MLRIPLLLSLASIAPLAAQVDALPTSQEPAAPILTAADLRVPLHVLDADGRREVWTAAASFKASFHDGFEFLACLGDGFPRNLPWRWRTVSVEAGAELLPLAAVPAPSFTDWRVEYDLGSVREVYDVREGGIEQSFVIARRPAGTGAIVVRGEVTTELVCEPSGPAHRGLVFCDPRSGQPIVGYGAATAIDANGTTLAIDSAFDGSAITLTVPADWVANARFPVVIDPLTTAVILSTSSLGPVATTDVAVEGESATSNLLFCIERAFSATDHDVYAFVCNGDFSSPSMVMSDTSTAFDDRGVCCAFVAGADRWLIGWTRQSSASDNDVRVWFHDKQNRTLNSGIGVTRVTSTWERNPDLGGTFLGSSGVLGLIVFQVDANSTDSNFTQVIGVPVNAQTRTFGIAQQYTPGGVVDLEQPSINQVSGQDDGWIVAYASTLTGLGLAWDIAATRTDRSGVAIRSTRIVAGGQRHLASPRISGMFGYYTLTYLASADLTSRTAVALHARRHTWVSTSSLPSDLGTERTIATASPPLTTISNADLAENHLVGSTAVAVYTTTRFLLPTSRTSAIAVRLGGTGVAHDSHTVFSSSSASALAPSIAFAYPAQDYPIVYGTNESSIVNPLYGTTYRYPAEATELRYGTGCGIATIDGNRPYVGNQLYSLNLVSAPPSAPAVLLVAFGPGNTPLDGIGMQTCVLNIDTNGSFSVPATVSGNGHGSVSLALPDDPAAIGNLFFQWIYANPGSNTLGAQATRGLEARIR